MEAPRCRTEDSAAVLTAAESTKVTALAQRASESSNSAPKSRRLRQTGRGLGKDITPTSRSPNIGVAKPKLIVERFAIFGSLCPQQRGNNCSITPDPHFPGAIFLTLINRALAPRFL